MTEQSVRTFIGVAQSVAFQRYFGFELFTAQIAEVTSLCVVPVHVSLQVIPAAACVVAHAADVRLHTCTRVQTHALKGRQQLGKHNRMAACGRNKM